RDRLQIFLGDTPAILVAQEIFQQHFHRERQAGNPLEPVLLGSREAVEGIGLGADLEEFAAPEAVERSHDGRFPPDRRTKAHEYGKTVPVSPFVAGRDIRAGCVSHARFDRIYKVFFCAVPENRHLSSTRVRTGGFWGIPAAGWESG